MSMTSNKFHLASETYQVNQYENSNQLPNIYRERFSKYFMNEGAVEWQWEKATNNEF